MFHPEEWHYGRAALLGFLLAGIGFCGIALFDQSLQISGRTELILATLVFGPMLALVIAAVRNNALRRAIGDGESGSLRMPAKTQPSKN